MSTLYRYGTPPTLSALAALIDEDAQQDAWRMYVADMSCRLTRVMSAGKHKPPYYSELHQPGSRRTDSRTGQEIVDSIISRRRKSRAGVNTK